ncbi:hypothetical protein [uncultured Thiothrix sp.]|uniref:hypothetical protein n=1 Tax=uncultured Thiothrix sp. TaxID=223185 RepID=UPI0026078857|nr:hypothetical protein [uncultured Thiothrix sp.]
MKSAQLAKNLIVSPHRLFIYAQAFRFSSGRGRCFSPGFGALLAWQALKLKQQLLNRGTLRWWRVWLGKG